MSQISKRRASDAVDLAVRKRQMNSMAANVKIEEIETSDETRNDNRTDELKSRLTELNVDGAHRAEKRPQDQQSKFEKLVKKNNGSPQSSRTPKFNKENSLRLLEAEMEVVELEHEVKRLNSKLLRQQRLDDQTKLRLENELAQKERI